MERRHQRVLEKVRQAGQLKLQELFTDEMTAAADLVAEGLLDYQQRRDKGSLSMVVYGYLTKHGKCIAAQLEVEDEEGIDLTEELGPTEPPLFEKGLVSEGVGYRDSLSDIAVIGYKCPTCNGELVDITTQYSEVMELLCVSCGEMVYTQLPRHRMMDELGDFHFKVTPSGY